MGAPQYGLVEKSSIPSRSVSVLNLPEPEVNLEKSKFVYNRFERDESLKISPTIPTSYFKSRTDANEYIENTARSQQPARFVNIVFKSNTSGYNSTDTLSPEEQSLFDNLKNDLDNEKLRLDSIITEGGLSNFFFSGIEMFDTQADTKLFSVLKAASSATATNTNTNPKLAADSYKNRLLGLGQNVVDPQLIDNFLANLSQQSVALKNATDDISEYRYQDISTTINSIFIDDIVKTALDDRCHIFEDEMRGLSSITGAIQNNASNLLSSDEIKNEDYGVHLSAGIIHDYVVLEDPTITLSEDREEVKFRHIGFTIEKIEYFGDEVRNFKPRLIAGANKTQVIDPKVRYGARYVYKVRNLFATFYDFFNDNEVDPNINQFYRGVFVTASKPSFFKVHCIETVKPNPPVDLKFSYDPSKPYLKFSWRFPVNYQNDIKGFQVFRRDSIEHPFTLMAEYDFNDSFLKPLLREVAPREDFYRYQRTGEQPLIIRKFYDETFEPGKKYIYAVASVDAHGQTSKLSSQFMVKYNLAKEELEKTLVSREKAPKAYPNIYITKNVFIDSMKTSNKKRLTVYFDPEYYDVYSNKKAQFTGNTEKDYKGLISFVQPESESPSYIINFLNIDLQKFAKLNIKIINDSMIDAVIDGALIDENNLSFSFIDTTDPENSN